MTRMVGAELLKLRRNRAVWIGAALVVFALPLALLAMTFLVDRGRLGGTDRTIVTMALLLGPGLIGAAMIGTTAGGADREAGVLRSLASTGVPRSTLFWVRLPAVVIAAMLLATAAWAFACVLGTVVHVGTPPVTVGWALEQLPSLLLGNVVIAVATLGLCSAGFPGAAVLGFVLALTLGLMPILVSSDLTPDWLFALMPPIAVTELAGGRTIVGEVPIPVGWALVSVAAWTLGALAVGLGRLRRAEL
jgi:hypothetical protein